MGKTLEQILNFLGKIGWVITKVFPDRWETFKWVRFNTESPAVFLWAHVPRYHPGFTELNIFGWAWQAGFFNKYLELILIQSTYLELYTGFTASQALIHWLATKDTC